MAKTRASAAWMAIASVSLLLAACSNPAPVTPPSPGIGVTATSDQDTLRAFAPDGFQIGSAVAGGGHHLSQSYPDPFTGDQAYRDILATEFTSLTPENQLKWEFLRPTQDSFDFEAADAIVAFAEENGQRVRGHALLWHSQNPAWLENGNFTPDELKDILHNHITTVVSRYASRIDQWDVANEIFDDSGEFRAEENIWIRELGPGIIWDAFEWAHAADPSAKLFLNDYNIEQVGPKSDAYYALAQELLDHDIPLDGLGIQGHLSIEYGAPSMRANLERFANLGLELAVTELDVRVPVEDGEPAAADVATQAEYYSTMLEACLAVKACTSFTLWGLPDKYSWVPHFFDGEGAATVMWDDFSRKPAYCSVQELLAEASGATADAAFTDRGCAG